jgi:hypothetical protein
VIRVDAYRADTSQVFEVVDDQTFGDWANEMRVREPVSHLAIIPLRAYMESSAPGIHDLAVPHPTGVPHTSNLAMNLSIGDGLA